MRFEAKAEAGTAGAFSKSPGASRALSVVGAAWVLSVGVDFLLHAGLLARLYLEPSPFLLPPEVALRRIPLGYLTFLILTAALYWLFRRLDIRGPASGLRLGGVVGFVVWGALSIGLYSISTAAWPLLVAWWIGQSIELALAGAVLGAAVGGTPLKRLWSVVAIAFVCCFAVTVILQNLGLAPAVKQGQ